MWSFACTIKIHCACWDLRPRPQEAPIPPEGTAPPRQQAGGRRGPGRRARDGPALRSRTDAGQMGGTGSRVVAGSGGGQLSSLLGRGAGAGCEHMGPQASPGRRPWSPQEATAQVGGPCEQRFPRASLASGHHHSLHSPLVLLLGVSFLFHCNLFSNIKDKLEAEQGPETRFCCCPGLGGGV